MEENTVQYHLSEAARLIKKTNYHKPLELMVKRHAAIIDRAMSYVQDANIAEEYTKIFKESHGASWSMDQFWISLTAIVKNTKDVPEILKWLNKKGYRLWNSPDFSKASTTISYSFKGGDGQLNLNVTLTESNCHMEQKGTREVPNMVLVCD